MKVHFLLLTYLSVLLMTPAGSFNLPLCQPVKQRVSFEKEGCQTCLAVETTICGGHCFTKDTLTSLPTHPYHQQQRSVCTYQDFHYETVQLPDCLPGVDPTITYPVATSCHCGNCSSETTVCYSTGHRPEYCKNDIRFYF